MPRPNEKKEEQPQEEEKNTITPQEFDIRRFGIRHNKRTDSKQKQEMNFPKYYYGKEDNPTKEMIEKKGKPLVVVTDEIKITRGGIPQYSEEADEKKDGPDHANRAYFYLPVDGEGEGPTALKKMIEQIDEYMTSKINEDGNKDGILAYEHEGKSVPYDKLFYSEMMTESSGENIPDEKKKAEYVPYQRIKVKLATEYEPEKQSKDAKITMALYVGEDAEEPVEAEKVSDVEKYLKWGCTGKFAIGLNKVWISKAIDPALKKRKCGIVMKCHQVCITEEAKSQKSEKTNFNRNLFSAKKPKSATTKPATTKTDDKEGEKKGNKKEEKKDTKNEKDDESNDNSDENSDDNSNDNSNDNSDENSDDNSNDNSSSDSEPEPEKKPQPKGTKGKSAPKGK